MTDPTGNIKKRDLVVTRVSPATSQTLSEGGEDQDAEAVAASWKMEDHR